VEFARPVDPRYPIKAHYGDKGSQYDWSMERDTGYWLPMKGEDGLGEHRGTDFDCPIGTIVRAMSDGMILRSRFENSLDTSVGAGLYILQIVSMMGRDSWVLKYSHLKGSYVKPAQRVRRGDPIAESGMSGKCLYPTLHVDLMNLQHQWRPIVCERD